MSADFFEQILRANPGLTQVSTYVQLAILAGFGWFLLRSRAIRALQQSMREQGRRIGSLEREVARLAGLLERFGCTDALECKNHRPFAAADVFARDRD